MITVQRLHQRRPRYYDDCFFLYERVKLVLVFFSFSFGA